MTRLRTRQSLLVHAVRHHMRRMREICSQLDVTHAELESASTKWVEHPLFFEYQRHLRWSMARLELSIAIGKRIGVRNRQIDRISVSS